MSGRPPAGPGSGDEGVGEDLARAADELAAVASQGQADVEAPTGGEGAPAGSDVEGEDAETAAPDESGAVDPDDVAPGPDVEADRGSAGGPGA